MMSTRRESKQGNYRISLRLDQELDADLISWLEDIPRGKRSDVLRKMMRECLQFTSPSIQQDAASPNLEAIRAVVADEIHKALKDKHFMGESLTLNLDQHDMEAKYGDKLNRMLGGFASHRND
jgi:hypothetical protein